VAKGAVVRLEQVWPLARAWYVGRAEESWSPRTPEAAQQVFTDLGLTGPFWQVR
jgi:hypothetical protein